MCDGDCGQCVAPQVGCLMEEKDKFWTDLDEVVESIPMEERVVIGADFKGVMGGGVRGEVGQHQGSALIPCLFATMMDRMTDDIREESPWTMMLADDIVICSENKGHVEEKLESWI